MKNLKKIFSPGLIYMFFLLANEYAIAQPTISGNSLVCPGQEEVYTLSGCAMIIAAPSPPSSGQVMAISGNSITIEWNNNHTSAAVVFNCASANVIFPVTIKSVDAPIFVNNSPIFIPCGSGSSNIQVAPVANADEYHWELPSGITPANTLITTVPIIAVNYSANASGTISVRAKNNSCDFEGPSSTINVTRHPPLPTLTRNSSNLEMCNGESWVFTAAVPGLANNYGWEWSATNGLLINGQSGTVTTTNNSAVVSAPGNAFGNATVQVRANNGICPPSPYRGFSFQVGTISSSQFQVQGPSNACANQLVYFTAAASGSNSLAGATNYLWTWPSDWVYLGGQSTNQLDLQAPNSFYFNGAITCRVTNRCGTTNTPAVKFVNSVSCFSSFNLSAYPNPSAKEVFIEVSIEEDQKSKHELAWHEWLQQLPDLEVTCFNDRGEKQAVVWLKNGKGHLLTEHLPKGTYYLSAEVEGKAIQKQILVNK